MNFLSNNTIQVPHKFDDINLRRTFLALIDLINKLNKDLEEIKFKYDKIKDENNAS